jgi:5-methylcytosine-specific restriction endonuclease McrA
MPRAQRAEFSKKTKLEAWTRAGGRCECGCGLKIIGTPEYHHVIEAAVGGSADVGNCQVLDPKCHRKITSEKTVPAVERAKRLEEKRLGLRTKRGGFRKPPAGYDPWRRTMRETD